MATSTPIAQFITIDTIVETEKVIGLNFTLAERELMVEGLNQRLVEYEKLRAIPLDNRVAPAFVFEPRQPTTARPQPEQQPIILSAIPSLQRPHNLEELAFYPVTHLAKLLETRQVTALELTQMYLARLKRYDPVLQCVVTLTEELALAQATRADAEIASGQYRGPLHGIPWGAKDLLAVRGAPTTWGALPYRNQVFDLDATVVQRLEAAGAVLLAKLTTGSLAWGDVWFGGKTKNPWNTEQGASGSSAGSASATAAGLVGFAIGTETMGSITSPCARCGVTGLRPTYGRVSRHGAMALSCSMDKIGPICRSVEDCALVFQAIHGPDGKDVTVIDQPFVWKPDVNHTNLRDLRIGYVKRGFATEHENKPYDDATLETLRSLGATLIPIELPDYPHEALMMILYAEAAAAFDDLTRSNRDDLLARQGKDAWPNQFRMARLMPAVEYIQLNRIRTQVMQDMAKVMARVDVYLQPDVDGSDMAITNFTGHPAVVLPNGLSSAGIPTSAMIFIGQLDGEAQVLAVAKAYQDATEFHQQHPPLAS
jgi:Asp-tRNA(Asn)/Glu-tRNA(Gln) amidotransferase A subunit family amidase